MTAKPRDVIYTPWGPAQGVTVLEEGVVWCSTAGHGGLGFIGEAQKKLSPKLRSYGLPQEGGVWYEEDCLWALPIIVRPVLAQRMCATGLYSGLPENLLKTAYATVRRWNPEFFEDTPKPANSEVV